MPTDPTPFRIEPAGTRPIEFDGWVIGEASSRDRPVKTRRDSKERTIPARRPDRWSEVAIYLTSTKRWVVETVGRSVIPGERDLVAGTICDTPQCVIDALKVPATGAVTTTALTALAQAAKVDPRLESVLIERI